MTLKTASTAASATDPARAALVDPSVVAEIAGRGAEATVAAHGAKAVAVGSGTLFLGGLTESQIAMLVGVVVGVVGLIVTIVFHWLAHVRAERVAAATIAALQRGRRSTDVSVETALWCDHQAPGDRD